MSKRENAEKFVKEVEKLAWSYGLDFFLVTNDKVTSSNNLGNDPIITKMNEEYRKFTSPYSSNGRTWRNFYDYIQTASRTDTGEHYPFAFNETSNFVLHIYDNKRQVNICNNNIQNPENDVVYCNIIFNPEDNVVDIIPVINGVSIYDNKFTCLMDMAFEGMSSIDWYRNLENGKLVKELLRDIKM